MASRIERFSPVDGEFDDGNEEECYELARVEHRFALRRLQESFPDLEAGPLLAHASQHRTRPCPCGRGALAVWPWVVQTAQLVIATWPVGS